MYGTGSYLLFHDVPGDGDGKPFPAGCTELQALHIFKLLPKKKKKKNAAHVPTFSVNLNRIAGAKDGTFLPYFMCYIFLFCLSSKSHRSETYLFPYCSRVTSQSSHVLRATLRKMNIYSSSSSRKHMNARCVRFQYSTIIS